MGNKPLPYISGNVPHPSEVQTGCRFYTRCSVALPKCKSAVPPLIAVTDYHTSRCWLHQEEVSQT